MIQQNYFSEREEIIFAPGGGVNNIGGGEW